MTNRRMIYGIGACLVIIIGAIGMYMYSAPAGKIPEESKYCVSHMGIPMSTGACSKIGIDARRCDQEGDCTSTCGYGCVNMEWYRNRGDCEANPEYKCGCIKGYCQKI